MRIQRGAPHTLQPLTLVCPTPLQQETRGIGAQLDLTPASHHHQLSTPSAWGDTKSSWGDISKINHSYSRKRWVFLFVPKQISFCSQKEDNGNTSTFLYLTSVWNPRDGDDPPIASDEAREACDRFQCSTEGVGGLLSLMLLPVQFLWIMKDIQCLEPEKGEKHHKIPNRFLPCPLPQAALMSAWERTRLQTHKPGAFMQEFSWNRHRDCTQSSVQRGQQGSAGSLIRCL